jgi:hypothetical protein
MAGSIPSYANFGSFSPTTFIWEIQQIQSSDFDPKLKDTLVRLYQNLNQMQIILNGKDSAIYTTEEFINGQLYFPNPLLASSSSTTPTERQVFRKVIEFGPLPNNTSISMPHNIEINSTFSLTRLYGASTNSTVTSLIPLPFASPTAADNIQLEATNTNIVITTGKDQTAYTTTYIVIEYLKQ